MADPRQDIVVVGAGAFGAWTALELVERGARVTLVDAYGPGNAKGSSGGDSRNIRAAYGDREIYTRWAMRAWDLWLARESSLGVRWLFPSGSLRCLGKSEAQAQCAVFDALRYPFELLSADEVRKRWPQITYTDRSYILFEPRSGILKARDAMIDVVQHFTAVGGRLVRGRARLPQGPRGRLGTLDVDGATLAADAFVFACGPWLPRLFPALLGRLIKTPRRELFFLGPAQTDCRYAWDRCPNLTDEGGWTSSDVGGGVKIAPVIRHVPMDPDDGDRTPSPPLLDQVRQYVASRLPGLAGRPVVATYVSQLENTDNEHFIIDRHPELADVIIAGGGSGHAYKMGPVIGEYVAGLTLGESLDPELAALFGLAAHGAVGDDAGG